MRSGPVLIDLPIDVQLAEIEFDIDTYEPLAAYKPTASRMQAEKAIAMLNESERPLLVSGGGVINADASDLMVELAEVPERARDPHTDGLGHHSLTTPPSDGRACGLTSHRYGNANMLASDFVFGIGNRWANRHTGSVEVYTKGRKFVHVDIEPTQIGPRVRPDYGIVSDAKAALSNSLPWPRSGRLQASSSAARHGWLNARAARQRRVPAQDELRQRADDSHACTSA